MKTLTLILLSFAIFCFAGSAIVAQDIQTRGSINGDVKDKNGAAIVGATVKITGQTGERTTTTNDLGLFNVENLVPGNYTVRLEVCSLHSNCVVAGNEILAVQQSLIVRRRCPFACLSRDFDGGAHYGRSIFVFYVSIDRTPGLNILSNYCRTRETEDRE